MKTHPPFMIPRKKLPPRRRSLTGLIRNLRNRIFLRNRKSPNRNGTGL